ncbi:MAG TPA: MFS transporter [Dermatophilaceae bacterium]|nr:MFS transporter [Dermatophilaceae bacterium]
MTLIGLVSLIAFEAMAISTIMPTVAVELRAGEQYGLAFSLMFTAQLLGIVLAGPWIDGRGPWPSLWLGQTLFVLGSMLAGAAPTLWVLLAGRVVAGLGAGLVVVAIYVVIGLVYPERLRPRVFGWISAAWVLPSVVGPLLAAWLTQVSSWRVVFLLVVPAGGLIATALWVRRAALRGSGWGSGPGAGGGPAGAGRAGDARRTVRLGVLVAAGAGVFQWASTALVPPRPGPVGATVAGLAGVAAAAPRLVPAGTWLLRRGLPSVIAARFLLTAAMNGALTFVPLMLVQQRALSVGQAGMLLALVSVGWAGGSLTQGRSTFLGRSATLIVAGGWSLAASLVTIAGVAALSWPTWVFVPAMGVCGLGMGLAMSSTSVLTLQLSAQSEHARASSALQLSDVLGSTMGIGVCSAVYAAAVSGLTLDPGSATGGVAQGAAPGAGAVSGSPAPMTFAVMWALTAAVGAAAAWAGARTRRS